ncbi:MAG TPA: hypothetical protein PKB03_03650 [Baekduia sp.]|nr:hypothetical protein [Baekduia sp.]
MGIEILLFLLLLVAVIAGGVFVLGAGSSKSPGTGTEGVGDQLSDAVEGTMTPEPDTARPQHTQVEDESDSEIVP